MQGQSFKEVGTHAIEVDGKLYNVAMSEPVGPNLQAKGVERNLGLLGERSAKYAAWLFKDGSISKLTRLPASF